MHTLITLKQSWLLGVVLTSTFDKDHLGLGRTSTFEQDYVKYLCPLVGNNDCLLNLTAACSNGIQTQCKGTGVESWSSCLAFQALTVVTCLKKCCYLLIIRQDLVEWLLCVELLDCRVTMCKYRKTTSICYQKWELLRFDLFGYLNKDTLL